MRIPDRTQAIISFALMILLATLFLIMTANRADASTVQPAEVYHPTSHTPQPDDWSWLIAQYWTGGDFDTAMSIMECESGGDPTAVSDTDDHGLFQHNAWSNPGIRFESMGYTWADRYDPEANVAAAWWLWDREGWSPWTCSRLIGNVDWFEPVTVDLLADPHTGLRK